MKYLIMLLSLFCFLTPNAQDCKCEKELDFVTDYYEENLPGFMDNVNEKNVKSYNKFKAGLKKQTKTKCDNENECFKILLTYVEFFKDNHSSIYQNRDFKIDEKNSAEVNKFINSKKILEREIINNPKIKRNSAINNIENTYQSDDSTYTVSIIRNKNSFRDYVGIIEDSGTPLWKKGQVKFELKKVGENTFDMFLYMPDHSMEYSKNVKLKNGILNDRWFNINLEERKSYNISAGEELAFKELDKETNYMYIPTFSGKRHARLVEFYKRNDSLIQSKPYLIIDVRNNGGGNDDCVKPLLKYIYTKPFYDDSTDIYSTKENIRKSIKWYEETKNDTVNFDKEFFKGITDEINRMQSVNNKTFITRSKGELIKLDTVLNNSKKIAIIINKHCASSCETLLFWALESDKTILTGENSGGYVGYGEISKTNTPNFNFELGCTMTRYNKQREYEVIGISPKYYLNNNKDWIEQTIEILKK